MGESLIGHLSGNTASVSSNRIAPRPCAYAPDAFRAGMRVEWVRLSQTALEAPRSTHSLLYTTAASLGFTAVVRYV
jgi:hypothetical protein